MENDERPEDWDPELERLLKEGLESEATEWTEERSEKLRGRIMEVIKNDSRGMDRILGREFPVLDEGFIQVVDYMGTDASITQAARTSYGQGTKRVHDERGLLRYLMRHYHTTPFEMCELKLRVRVPMDCWRQWIRHRMASVNEYSTRYSEAIDSAQRTRPGGWRTQSTGNRQGSDGYLKKAAGARLTEQERDLHEISRNVYEQRLQEGVAREQARKDLPLSTYTEAYWKIDLHNLLHFLRLRMDSHAQQEIREYANAIAEVVKQWLPITWEAFEDYRLQSMPLTRLDIEVINAINSSRGIEALLPTNPGWHRTPAAVANGFGWGSKKVHREREECEVKLAQLGFDIPWQWGTQAQDGMLVPA